MSSSALLLLLCLNWCATPEQALWITRDGQGLRATRYSRLDFAAYQGGKERSEGGSQDL
jgi:hypothetical protein